ncbi:MAG: hypothetical protein MK316_00130 [Pseudomonadales bacterium]|nr:hypothetical protein [Pseudomonadales bacterium]
MSVTQTRVRWGLVCLATLILVALPWLHQHNTRLSIMDMLHQMEGEHWYRVSLNQQPVGQYRTEVHVDRTIRIATEMQFRLDSPPRPG